MADVILTKDGYKKLEQELKDLIEITLPDIKIRMATARADGDLSENNAWITAKEEMEISRFKISKIKKILRDAKLVDNKANSKSETVSLGSTVTIKLNDNKMTFTLVPTLEADATQNKLSSESPIGKAIIGKKVGEKAVFQSPAGDQKIEILSK